MQATGPESFLEDLAEYAREVARQGPEPKWFRAVLIREPGNPYDSNAIAVYADRVGQVGHLSRDDALEYQQMFEALSARGCSVATCPAFLIGGTKQKPSFGVMLCLSAPERVIAELNAS
ncbi:MAG: HIRAN domain-containing protein [Gaiellaceae bacterium]